MNRFRKWPLFTVSNKLFPIGIPSKHIHSIKVDGTYFRDLGCAIFALMDELMPNNVGNRQQATTWRWFQSHKNCDLGGWFTNYWVYHIKAIFSGCRCPKVLMFQFHACQVRSLFAMAVRRWKFQGIATHQKIETYNPTGIIDGNILFCIFLGITFYVTKK